MSNLTILQTLIFSLLVTFSCIGIGAFTWALCKRREMGILAGFISLVPTMVATIHLVGQ